MNNIILIGMSGAGKSTIGVLLAKALGYTFIDTDLIIQEQQGQLLQEIIDLKGMESFLQAEEYAILGLKSEGTVIATGGSVIYSPKAMAHLKSLGKILYLKIPCEVIEKRLNDISSRGIIMGNHTSFKSLYDERESLYEHYADTQIECQNLTMNKIVSTIYDLIK